MDESDSAGKIQDAATSTASATETTTKTETLKTEIKNEAVNLEKISTRIGEIDVPDNKNRFNVVYQKMLNIRWYITIVTMFTLILIIGGIGLSIVTGAKIEQQWKELLLLLLGAFIGSYNRVIDYWFNNSQRDDKLIEKMDQENDSDDLAKSKIAMQNKIDLPVVDPK